MPYTEFRLFSETQHSFNGGIRGLFLYWLPAPLFTAHALSGPHHETLEDFLRIANSFLMFAKNSTAMAANSPSVRPAMIPRVMYSAGRGCDASIGSVGSASNRVGSVAGDIRAS